MSRFSKVWGCGFLVLLLSPAALANLLGDEISCSLSATTQVCSTQTAIVDAAAVEFTFGHDGYPTNAEVDFDAEGFTVRALRQLGFGSSALTISDLDWSDPNEQLTGATLINRGVNGSPSIASFDGHSITVILNGDWQPGDAVEVSFQATAVPMPPAICLFTAGLGGVLCAVRRRRQRMPHQQR